MQKMHSAFETNMPHNFTWKLSRTIISTNHRFPPRDNLQFTPKVCPPLFQFMSVPKHLATDLLITDDDIAGHFCITRDLVIFFFCTLPSPPSPKLLSTLSPGWDKKTNKQKGKKKRSWRKSTPPPPSLLPSLPRDFWPRANWALVWREFLKSALRPR